MKNKVLVYIAVVIFSAVLLYVWSSYANNGAEIFKHSVESASAKILSVHSKDVTSVEGFNSTAFVFNAEIISGPRKGETVKVYQEHNSDIPDIKVAEPGDKVIIKNYPFEDVGTEWAIDNHLRTPALFYLAILFVALIIILGKSKGLRTVISLIYTVISVFAVFIPSVLSGKNIYLSASLVCIFIIAMTLLLVNGWDKKTFCASLGCIGGVLAAAIITSVFSNIMKFTGYTDEHTYYLTMLPHPVDLGAIGFSAIIIGAVGAVMDVAMSMASSLYELSIKVPDISFKSIISSGFSIGRDMMGTMANTLVLAYVGSSLCSVLLLLTYSDSAIEVLNREMIAYEILQAIAGSIGIILTIPVTALICGLIYVGKKNRSFI